MSCPSSLLTLASPLSPFPLHFLTFCSSLKSLSHSLFPPSQVIDDPKNRKIFLVQELMEGGALMPDSENCEPMTNEVRYCIKRAPAVGVRQRPDIAYRRSHKGVEVQSHLSY